MNEAWAGRNELYLLSSLQRRTRAWFAARIERFDITVPMFRVMFEIHHASDDLTSSELARRTYVSVQTVNLVVQTLSERGLVDRSPTGQGRSLALSLTEAGSALLTDMRAEHAAVIDAMTAHAGVTSHDVRDLLARMISSVDRVMAEETAGLVLGDSEEAQA